MGVEVTLNNKLTEEQLSGVETLSSSAFCNREGILMAKEIV
jgi:hypothetical protein